MYSRTFIYAPTGICAVYQDSIIGDGVTHLKEMYYIHTDYQGSWLAITDAAGSLKNKYSYDAWGRPRNANTWQLDIIGTTNPVGNLMAMQPRFDRGYTGHEMVCGFGLINMNGRLYDPYLQRFLSPDPVVQNPYNSQNYNRYSYVLNNPLKYTDPSGYYSIFDGLADVFALGGYSATKETYKVSKWNVDKVNLQTAWLITLPASCIDAINNGWSRLDPFNKGSISNNAYQINNGLFAGTPKQIISRFTWESPQTLTGLTVSQFYNYVGDVRSVDFYDGATVVRHFDNGFTNYFNSKNNDGLWGAFTLSSFINGDKSISADPYNHLFQHEYGHYLQSQDLGPTYLFKVALPSLIDCGMHPNTHNRAWFEEDANARAIAYWNKTIPNYDMSQWDPLNRPAVNASGIHAQHWYDYALPPLSVFLFNIQW